MGIPRVVHAVRKQDFTIRPLTVHKSYLVQKGDLYSGSMPQTSSGYRLWEGLWTGEKLKLGTNSESTYPTNSFDGSYKNIIWSQLDAQYYRFPYDTCATLEHSNKRFSRKFLNYSASIISLPYLDYGESIKPGSVEITGSNFYLTDDRNGNLYDVSLNTGSYSDRHNLVAYWGFNDEFRKMKELPYSPTGKYDGNLTFAKTAIKFDSAVFSPDFQSTAVNVTMLDGVFIDAFPAGQSAYFDNQSDLHFSYILTDHISDFNFSKYDDFTISFWVQPFSNGPTQTLISKNTILKKQVQGFFDKPNANGEVISTYYVSSSTQYEPTPIYPYRFELSELLDLGSPQLLFRRSDGITTLQLSGSSNLANSDWHHIAVVKSGSLISLYEDGILQQTSQDISYHCHNNHSLMFGNDSFNNYNRQGNVCGLNGSLDEIRFFNKGLSSDTILTLADRTGVGMFQTSIVGNVFYRGGKIVISSLDLKYNQILNQNWTLRYKGTHTIYEYETLVRIKKGTFNHTTNKTWLKSPESDLIIDEATGSLRPYFTQINLFDSEGDLVAVGKMNQAIQTRSDTDINVAIKFHG